MTTIQIPLDKNPDVAALIADKQPGDKIYGCFTIKAQDAQTATLRIEEMTDDPAQLPKPDEYDEEAGEGDDSAGEEKGEADQSPEGAEAEAKPTKAPGSMGRELAAKMMGGDNGSSF